MTKNSVNSQRFRTRFIHACNHKVAHIEALLAMSKQKAAEVGVYARKRRSLEKVQTKKSVPLGSKVCSGEVNHRSYAEVVKAATNRYNTKFKPRDCTTNFPARDQIIPNTNTNVTDTKHKGNAWDVVHNGVWHSVNDKGNETHYRDKDKDNTKYAQSQECKISDINGLNDKYLHSILTIPRDKKSWKNVNNEITFSPQ